MTSSPSPTPEQFKEQQRQQWATTAKTWRQWSAELAAQTRAATELMLQEAQVRPGMQVLDLASGTGEPALSLAAAVAPDGQVTATDLVPVMLAVTQEHALTRGLTNLTTQQADIEALPFSDASFDAITCRFGIMFCPDMPRAMEVRAVPATATRGTHTLPLRRAGVAGRGAAGGGLSGGAGDTTHDSLGVSGSAGAVVGVRAGGGSLPACLRDDTGRPAPPGHGGGAGGPATVL